MYKYNSILNVTKDYSINVFGYIVLAVFVVIFNVIKLRNKHAT